MSGVTALFRVRLALAAIPILLLPIPAMAQDDGGNIKEPFLGYQTQMDFIPTTPSVSGGSVSAFANPAAWATSAGTTFDFWWGNRPGSASNWGFAFGENLGFAMHRQRGPDELGAPVVYNYQLGFAGGNRAGYFGLGWRWATGATRQVGRENGLTLGFISRPGRYVTFGASGIFSAESSARLGVFDLGIRPFGSSHLTLFGDYELTDAQRIDEGGWGAGVQFRPVRGTRLGVKFRDVPGTDDYRFSLEIGLTLDGLGFDALPSYTEDQDRSGETYLVRLSPPHWGVPVSRWLRSRGEPRDYVAVSLEKRTLTYQTTRWFSGGQVRWLDVVTTLNKVRDDPGAAGVVVNISGMRASSALAWELREKLREIRDGGKEVIIHADRLNFMGYYVASVANEISLDPEGRILLPGLAIHRTYLADALAKLGVGFDEWRYFTYKSALESYSRDTMSEPDRVQTQRMIDVIYEEIRSGVTTSRSLSDATFDALVDSTVLFNADMALRAGVVDMVGRWHDLGKWLHDNRDQASMSSIGLNPDPTVKPDERWGRPPQVALVYALGPCSMDSGIQGRRTSAFLRGAARSGRVKGVVLRVDSPGGDPLPSDLVAEGMRKVRGAGKPAVVSQGGVAASGGYVISMDGHPIFTTPFTLTGSIGVIGGWVWDDGLGDKLGIVSDGVQRGPHADLFTGTRFPLVGRYLPTRDLTVPEKGLIEKSIRDHYGQFVDDVATARSMDASEVEDIAQGRVWMGEDAIDRGLCDSLGTLEDAIVEARRQAGLDPDDEVTLREFPEPGWFPPTYRMLGFPMVGALLRQVMGIPDPTTALGEPDPPSYAELYVLQIAEAPGRPLVLLPPPGLPPQWVGEGSLGE